MVVSIEDQTAIESCIKRALRKMLNDGIKVRPSIVHPSVRPGWEAAWLPGCSADSNSIFMLNDLFLSGGLPADPELISLAILLIV